MAEKRTMEKMTSPGPTTGDQPSEVRSSPCTIQGWRPTSAENQPS